MGTVVSGFAFNDFCQRCQKIMEHRIEVQGKELSGICSSCGDKRAVRQPSQVYYPKTDLWVTRFKIGNLQSLVAGKLLDAIKNMKNTK
jgi:hypothetical protein